MPQRPVTAIETTGNNTHTWLKELVEIGEFADESQAYSALRAALHSIRDRLTVPEAVRLAAQCPMLVRGFYFEGWKPSAAPNEERSPVAFLESVNESLRGNETIQPAQAAAATFQLLDRKISAGEMEDIRKMMPAEVRRLWS
jgi:uncharacterized protein (DUF2267 family)